MLNGWVSLVGNGDCKLQQRILRHSTNCDEINNALVKHPIACPLWQVRGQQLRSSTRYAIAQTLLPGKRVTQNYRYRQWEGVSDKVTVNASRSTVEMVTGLDNRLP